MDQHYDLQGASHALEQIASEQERADERQLANITKTSNWRHRVSITCVDHPQTWRILRAGENDGEVGDAIEEMIYTVQGIVCGLDLPPVLEKPSIAPARYKFLRQGLSITGAGSATFAEAIKSAQEVYAQFDRQFANGKLEKWSAAKYAGYHTIDLSNRYFTPKRDAPDMEHVPFTKLVDPRGILEDMAKSNYVHGEENVVQYYTCHVDEQRNRSYEDAKPQSFRIGDIVEVQMSFIAVPLKGQNFKMLTVFHSIALLDGVFTQDALKKCLSHTTEVKAPLKWRVGYDDAGRGKRLNAMDVGE